MHYFQTEKKCYLNNYLIQHLSILNTLILSPYNLSCTQDFNNSLLLRFLSQLLPNFNIACAHVPKIHHSYLSTAHGSRADCINNQLKTVSVNLSPLTFGAIISYGIKTIKYNTNMNFMNSIYLKIPNGIFAQCTKLQYGQQEQTT